MIGMPLSDTDRRKFRQRIQNATDKQFWDAQNVIHNDAYLAGVNLILETMWLHPKISKAMVEWVKEKAVGVREDWNKMRYVEVEDSILTLITGREAICPECRRKSEA
jgi:hypothetical protein